MCFPSVLVLLSMGSALHLESGEQKRVCQEFCVTVYFDDFLVFQKPAFSKHCEFVVGTYFKMLGWATSIDKENDVVGSLKALRIVIDLSDMKLLRVDLPTDECRFEVCLDTRTILEK